MAILNELHHAYLVGCFYDELKRAYGDMGVLAFQRGAKIYGEQRGNRMAMRAIRDGNDLSYDSYFQYGEWRNTPELCRIERSTTDGVMLSENFVCPWHTQFRAMGMLDCGLAYCSVIDRSLIRGFNPELEFDLESVLHDSPSCRLLFHVGTERKQPKPKEHPTVLSLEYHCAHVYWTYARTITSMFGDEGAAIAARVRERFAAEYGQEALDIVLWYEGCDFTCLPEAPYDKYLD